MLGRAHLPQSTTLSFLRRPFLPLEFEFREGKGWKKGKLVDGSVLQIVQCCRWGTDSRLGVAVHILCKICFKLLKTHSEDQTVS